MVSSDLDVHDSGAHLPRRIGAWRPWTVHIFRRCPALRNRQLTGPREKYLGAQLGAYMPSGSLWVLRNGATPGQWGRSPSTTFPPYFSSRPGPRVGHHPSGTIRRSGVEIGRFRATL